MFRFGGKFLILGAVVIDMLLIHNIYFYKEQKYKLYGSLLVALMGGVYNVA
jgi:hypothetical protein